MNEMIAFCGINCTRCPIYVATQKGDDSEKEKAAEECTVLFNTKVKPQDVSCDGCLPTGMRLFKYCVGCAIRMCALERHVEDCAYCDDYPCQKLGDWFALVPDAKATLDRIREGL